MIQITKLNNEKEWINHRLMEKMETQSNTIIHLTSGNTYIAQEKPEEIVELIVEFEAKVHYKALQIEKER